MKNIFIFTVFFYFAGLACCSKESHGEHDAPKLSTPPPFSEEKPKFKDMLGINAFEWNFGDQYTTIMPERAFFFQPFSSFRHYLDWRQIEQDKGKYGYNPTPRGRWKYDEIYEWCHAQGIIVVACIKTIPAWLLETYPPERRDMENVPAPYGADLSDPASYIDFAKLGFQFAARYGSNGDVDPDLVHVEPVPSYNPNQKKIGMGLVSYIECNNEPNRWWKPDKVAQQTAEEYAANLSAFYDGHKGTLGPGVGVKAADPEMQIVMGGIAKADPKYVAEMVEWCRVNRGLKADGSVDLCFDVINYHHYAHNRDEVKGRANQRGVAPELSPSADLASRFRAFSDENAYSIPVWNTEVGYDVNEHSVQRAIPINGKSALETQADWSLRTALLYARHGINRLFFYMLHDVNVKSTTQYASSGFVDKEGEVFTAKPAWDYLVQANQLIGEYHYQETLNTDPIVDVYALGDQKVYVLAIPDEVGRETKFELRVDGSKQVKIHELVIGAKEMKTTPREVVDGKITINVTETPIFIEAL